MKLQQRFFIIYGALFAVIALIASLTTAWLSAQQIETNVKAEVDAATTRIMSVLDATNSIMLQRVGNSMKLLKKEGLALGMPASGNTISVNGTDAPDLLLGPVAQGNDFALVDGLTSIMDGTATIFSRKNNEYIRIATNVIKNGKRAIGTKLSATGKAIKKIQKKEAYYGHVDILGMPFLTAYEPIFDKSNSVIGIWYVGYSADLKSLEESIGKEIILENGFVAILDGKNNIRMHSQHLSDNEIATAIKDKDNWHVESITFSPWGYQIAVGYPTGEVTQLVVSEAVKIFIGIVLSAIVILFITFYLLRSVVTSPLAVYLSGVEDIASGSGDLSKSFAMTGTQEFDQMSQGFNALVSKLRKTIVEVQHSVGGLGQMSDSLSTSVNEFNNSATALQHQAAQSADFVQAINDTSSEVADNAETALDSANNAKQLASDGHVLLNKSIASTKKQANELQESVLVITQLSQTSDNIGGVMDVISGIAEQTNLLALNAAIEAARAGEQGRGFAVVADEVRSLASRTQQSTGEIRHIVETLQENSNQARTLIEKNKELATHNADQIEQVGVELMKVLDSVNTITSMNADNAKAAKKQSESANELAKISAFTADAGEQNIRIAQHLNDLTDQLSQLSGALADIVSGYKTQ